MRTDPIWWLIGLLALLVVFPDLAIILMFAALFVAAFGWFNEPEG